MTRYVPSQLSAPRSALSLRQQAASPPHAPASMDAGHSSQSKLFVLADMAGRPRQDNTVCVACSLRLSPLELAHVTVNYDANHATSPGCKLCQVSATQPEAFTKPFCDFLRENPTVFHAVDYFKTKLSHSGYTELPARDSWAGRIRPGGKYWVSRNGSSLIAFAVGANYTPGSGISMIAGHIDAVTARLKPVSSKPTAAGYVQLGVAPYAGSLAATWWDRDLSIGGRVIVRDPSSGQTRSRLVKLDWPIAKIPTLAPHFGVGMMGSGNPETQAVPIIGLDSASPPSSSPPLGPAGSFINSQPPKLVRLIANNLGLDSPSSIVNWDLELYDSHPATTFGLDRELVSAGRIDDKLCSWAALMGLLASDDSPSSSSYIRLAAFFDDEEIGSLLRQGARGNFLPSTIERLIESLNPSAHGPGLFGQTMARSFLLSADVTHAGHPNFLPNYLPDHTPSLNVGLVLCGDSNGHMTTDAVSSTIMHRVAELSGSTLQNFQIRNDSRSGGTVGPMLSSALGVRCADAGLPQLSMHSIRATTGALDPGLGVKIFKGFYDHWEKIDKEWE